MGKRINISLYGVIISLILHSAFITFETVLGLTVCFAAYFVDKYVSIKPEHLKDIQEYENKLAKMEARISKISLKMGFGN